MPRRYEFPPEEKYKCQQVPPQLRHTIQGCDYVRTKEMQPFRPQNRPPRPAPPPAKPSTPKLTPALPRPPVGPPGTPSRPTSSRPTIDPAEPTTVGSTGSVGSVEGAVPIQPSADDQTNDQSLRFSAGPRKYFQSQFREALRKANPGLTEREVLAAEMFQAHDTKTSAFAAASMSTSFPLR